MSEENAISAGILERIRDIQQSRGLSAAAIARQAGIQKDRMYRLLDGQPFTVDDVWMLAAGLGIEPWDLLPVDPTAALSKLEADLLTAAREGEVEAVQTALLSMGVSMGPAVAGQAHALAAARELRTSAETIRAAADGIDRAARSLAGDDPEPGA